MPDETLIAEIETILAEVVELGAAAERTRMVPNLLVTDAAPTGLTGFVTIADDRDGDNILAKKVPGVIYSTNDLVNVLFVRGGEAIAFQQGSQSSNAGLWQIVDGTSTDIYYNSGDVGIGKSVAPDARLELLDTAQAQLRLTFEEDTKFADFTVDTNHDLTIDPSSTGLIKLNATVTIPDELQHEGDTDNKIGFTDDTQTYTVGGVELLKLTEAAQDIINLGPGSGDVDIDFNGDMFLHGANGRVSIGGSTTPVTTFEVDLDQNSVTSGRIVNNTNDTGAYSSWRVATHVTNDNQGFSMQVFSDNFNAFTGIDGMALGGWARFRSDSQVNGYILNASGTGSQIIFGTENTEVMRLDDSQNVGIGTTSPSTRLDIADGAIEFEEMSAPGAGAANTARLYAVDDGSGNTALETTAYLSLPDTIYHTGDTDNKIGFTDDTQTYTVGGVELLKLTEAAQDIINLGPGSGDVDIDFNGDMFLEGATGSLAVNHTSPTALIDVSGSTSLSPGILSDPTMTDGTGNMIGLQVSPGTVQTNSSGAFYGINSAPVYSGTTGTQGFVYGMVMNPAMSGSNTVTNMYGAFYRVDCFAGTITNAYATRVNNPSGGSTITNNYGLYVANLTRGTNNWAIYVDGTTLSHFGGAIEFAEMTAPGAGAANTARLYAEDSGGTTRQQIVFNGGNTVTIAQDGGLQTYTPTNVTTDRSYDANATSVAELADVLGTLIADFQAAGVLG